MTDRSASSTEGPTAQLVRSLIGEGMTHTRNLLSRGIDAPAWPDAFEHAMAYVRNLESLVHSRPPAPFVITPLPMPLPLDSGPINATRHAPTEDDPA